MIYNKHKIKQFSRQPKIHFQCTNSLEKNKIQGEVILQFFFFWLPIFILASTINQQNLSWSIGFPSQWPFYRMAVCFLLETVPVSLWSRWWVNWVQVGSLDNAIVSDIFQQESISLDTGATLTHPRLSAAFHQTCCHCHINIENLGQSLRYLNSALLEIYYKNTQLPGEFWPFKSSNRGVWF